MARVKKHTVADLLEMYNWREHPKGSGFIWQGQSKESKFGSYQGFSAADLVKESIDSGWTDVEYEISTESDYGDGYRAVFTMSGWVRASEDHINDALSAMDHARLQASLRDEQLAADLKKRRPDLFR